MDQDEKIIIERLAAGDTTVREEAITIHRKYLQTLGPRSNAHMRFMAEVDNKMPDLTLRANFRRQVLDGVSEHSVAEVVQEQVDTVDPSIKLGF